MVIDAGVVIRRAAKPAPLAAGKATALPASFEAQGRTLDTQAFLAQVETTGLLVLKDDRLVYETYWLGNDATTQTISWSVVKSVVSALMGIALHEGAIRSVEDPVTQYVPGLAGSGYDGVRIKDVLQMSSGVRWNEDYSDPQADINVFGRVFRRGESLDAFAARCVRGREPGTYNLYNSTDTHVIGMVLRHATGRSLSDYLKEKLWDPIGAEADAFWIVDDKGAEMAGGGLNAVLRDYARLGLLYQNGGALNGTQIVPESWVKASVTPDAPHLMPGPRPSALLPSGSGEPSSASAWPPVRSPEACCSSTSPGAASSGRSSRWPCSRRRLPSCWCRSPATPVSRVSTSPAWRSRW